MSASRLESTRIILFDVGNTLTYLDLDRVGDALASCGRAVPSEALGPAERVARAAMYRHYATHPESGDQARWTAYLATLLEELGAADPPTLEQVRARLGEVHEVDHLWNRVASGTREVLGGLARRGFRLGVVSNADGRVKELLESVSLADAFEVIVDSHLVGVEKPDPRIFEIALARLGAIPQETMYVGDFYAVDVVGARRARVLPVLLDPLDLTPGADCPVVRDLDDLPALLPARPDESIINE